MKKTLIISSILLSASLFAQRKISVPKVDDKAIFDRVVSKSGGKSIENISQINKDSASTDSIKKASLIKDKPVVRKKKRSSVPIRK